MEKVNIVVANVSYIIVFFYYFLDGHFLLAVSSGEVSMPIQCYNVSIKKNEDKCLITSHSLPSFFLYEGGPEGAGILLFVSYAFLGLHSYVNIFIY